MVNNSLIQVDLLEMNVSWISEDLELYQNGISGFLMSLSFTLLRGFTFVMAVIVHRAFYRLMKRLPGRAVNQIIYPYMVSFFCFFQLRTWRRVSPRLGFSLYPETKQTSLPHLVSGSGIAQLPNSLVTHGKCKATF